MDFYDILFAKNLGGGGGIAPSGTISISANGDYDVTEYAEASVDVPQPVGTLTITENGTYNVSGYAEADVDVSSGGSDSALIDLIERDITSLDIPIGTTRIGSYAFYLCSFLSSINIPSGVTSIGTDAFRGCLALKSVVIPNGVAGELDGTFRSCSNLESVDIPSGVISIGGNVFNGCSRLTSITVRATTPPSLLSSAFNNVPATANIYVPAGSVEAYKSANNWSARAGYIQAIPE